MRKIHVGIIGYGLSGRFFHGAILKSLSQYVVKTVVTTDHDKAQLVNKEHPQAKVVASAEDIFSDKDIELVVISSPNTSHFEYAKQAMTSGKHVLIEKPFAVSSKEAQELIEISRTTDQLLTIYHNRRYDSDFLTVKKIIESGDLGDLVEYHSSFNRFRPIVKSETWKEKPLPGSGIVYDLGSHLIDQSLSLFGKPDMVYADIRKQRKGIVDDNFEIILYYPDLKVSLTAGALVNTKLPKFLLLCKSGSFVKYGLDVQEEALRSGKNINDSGWGEEGSDLYGDLILDGHAPCKVKSQAGCYPQFYLDLYQAIVSGKPVPVSPQDALETIRIIEAAFKSNEEGQRIKL